MGGKRDKKKKSKDPLKKAQLAAKKDAKADKAALKRLKKEEERLSSLSISESDRDGDAGRSKKKKGGGRDADASDLDAILESYRTRTKELETAEVEDVGSTFPGPPRGNFTLTPVPGGHLYMYGGEYYDGRENLVLDEMLRWDPDARPAEGGGDDGEADAAETVNTGRWVRIHPPGPRPPARCAHSAVHRDGSIYVFGGEHASDDRYHHYRDLWRFDTRTNAWEEVTTRGGAPHARSGHRSVAWRHYMLLFGGFHESLRSETRWFNDVHIFDFQTATWTELKFGRLARAPPARSAANVAVCAAPTEALVVYGGYSKVKGGNASGGGQPGIRSEGITHTDCWVLPLKSLLPAKGSGAINGSNPPSWERVTRKGEYPSPRAGTSCVVHRNRMLVYGGVSDLEGDHHRMESVFYDDLFAFDMERRRWFAMRLKKAGSGGRRRRRRKGDGGAAAEEEEKEAENVDESSDDEEEGSAADGRNEEANSSGWDLNKLRHDMFAFIDADGNVVYEKIEDDGDGEGEGAAAEGDGETAGATRDEGPPEDGQADHVSDAGGSDAAPAAPEPDQARDAPPAAAAAPQSKPDDAPAAPGRVHRSSVMAVDASTGRPSPVARPAPLPRINSAAAVRGNTLYVLGGVLEVGDREVTLDDCWSYDLNGKAGWACLWPGTMHRQVWRGIDSDVDGDSYVSSDAGALDDDDESDDGEDDGGGFETIDEDGPAGMTEEERKKARKAAKKEKVRAEGCMRLIAASLECLTS